MDLLAQMFGIDWSSKMMMFYVAHLPFWFFVLPLQLIILRYAWKGVRYARTN